MHDVLKPPVPSVPEAALPDSNKLQELLNLAHEYTIIGKHKDAERKHQERLAIKEDPQVSGLQTRCFPL